jgi:hypothetical protein
MLKMHTLNITELLNIEKMLREEMEEIKYKLEQIESLKKEKCEHKFIFEPREYQDKLTKTCTICGYSCWH